MQKQEEKAGRRKMQGEIEIILILARATASEFLINFDINSIVITASPHYFVLAQHVENELRFGLSHELESPVCLTHSNNSRVMRRVNASARACTFVRYITHKIITCPLTDNNLYRK